MPLNNKYVTFLFSALIFVVFFSYFFITSNTLPHGAGPDWKSNTDVTKFIYENGRLAVLPADEKKLHFTVYGGTRALRPPLSYIVSAATAGALSFADLDSHVLFRKGSALLCALALALAFYALSIYFSSYRVGVLGALAIGLMPQFTFIASYNNDDSGAIFSATLMLAVLVRTYRYGISNTNAALIGLAGGLVIISKMTAWLLLPFIVLFLFIFVRASGRSLLRFAAMSSLLFILAGGWWLAMNMYHYGIDDPIQKNISSTMVEQHRRLPPEAGVGFAAQGIGYNDLLLKNHKNFLGETAKSTIGNMDWLKLRVGPLQYFLYISIFFIAMLYYFFSVATLAFRKIFGRPTNNAETRQVAFESLLFFIICFQFFMYTWTNINNDIQIQGKYLIPVFLPILLLFFSGCYLLQRVYSTTISKLTKTEIPVKTVGAVGPGVFLAGMAIVIFVHWDAWANYVIPFYKPPAYNVKLGKYLSIPLNTDLHQLSDKLEIRKTEEGILYISTGEDPKAIFRKEICQKISTTSMLHLEFYAEKAGTLQFFIDENGGFSSRTSFTASYKQGDNSLYLPIAADRCNRLRFDPFRDTGSILLTNFQIAPMTIVPRRKD